MNNATLFVYFFLNFKVHAVHSVYHSVQYVHPSPFAKVPLHFLIAGQVSGITFRISNLEPPRLQKFQPPTSNSPTSNFNSNLSPISTSNRQVIKPLSSDYKQQHNVLFIIYLFSSLNFISLFLNKTLETANIFSCFSL